MKAIDRAIRIADELIGYNANMHSYNNANAMENRKKAKEHLIRARECYEKRLTKEEQKEVKKELNNKLKVFGLEEVK